LGRWPTRSASISRKAADALPTQLGPQRPRRAERRPQVCHDAAEA
jgi:hypothetical protein